MLIITTHRTRYAPRTLAQKANISVSSYSMDLEKVSLDIEDVKDGYHTWIETSFEEIEKLYLSMKETKEELEGVPKKKGKKK